MLTICLWILVTIAVLLTLGLLAITIVSALFRALKKLIPSYEKFPVAIRAALVGGSIIVFVALIGTVKELAIVRDTLFVADSDTKVTEKHDLEPGSLILTFTIDNRHCGDWRLVRQDTSDEGKPAGVVRVFPNGAFPIGFPILLLTIENHSKHQLTIKKLELIRVKRGNEAFHVKPSEYVSVVMASFALSLPQGESSAVEIVPPLMVNADFAASFDVLLAPAGFKSRYEMGDFRQLESYELLRREEPYVLEGGAYKLRIYYADYRSIESSVIWLGRTSQL